MSGTVTNLPFVKMHGIGNDFVVVDCLKGDAPTQEALQQIASRLCDRRFGIGSDGLLLALPSATADFRMRMFNPDGSEAEMCGNGIRCLGKFLADTGYTDKSEVSVETMGGLMVLLLHEEEGNVTSVTVNMGRPRLNRADLPMAGDGSAVGEIVDVGGESVSLTGVSMGNPHAVFFVDSATDDIINHFGPLLEPHPLFPRHVNVHAAQIHNRAELTMLTWERGAGRTLACGTGACAVVVAAVLNNLTGRDVLAHLPGGDLRIEWRDDDHVYMTGAAATVFAGELNV